MAKKTAKPAKAARSPSRPRSRRREAREEGRSGEGAEGEEVRLLLRRRQGRRRPDDEGHARRQGLGPGRDDQRRPAGAAGLHDLHRGLQPLVRRGPEAAAGHRRRDDGARAQAREGGRRAVRLAPSNPLLVSVRSGAKFSMPGHDGHHPQPRPERRRPSRGSRRGRSNGRFAFDSYRRFIQMFGNVVLEIPKEKFEHEFEAVKHAHGAKIDTDLGEDGLRGDRRALQGARQEGDGQAVPAGPAAAAEGRRATPCSARGTTSARSSTAASTTSRTTSAPPSTCRRWCSATPATGRRPAWASRATRRPARRSSSASSSSTPRARTSWPASARRSRSPSSSDVMPKAYKELRDDHDAAREALQGHPGLRVHDRGREALHAADAQRQAHRLRGGRDRDRLRGREADHAEGGAAAGRARRRCRSCSRRCSTRPSGRSCRWPPRACRPRRARRRARWSSPPTRPWSGPSRARRCSWSGRRPCRTTSTAWRWRRAS